MGCPASGAIILFGVCGAGEPYRRKQKAHAPCYALDNYIIWQ